MCECLHIYWSAISRWRISASHMVTMLQIVFCKRSPVWVWGGICGQCFRDEALHSPPLTASSRVILVPKSTVVSPWLGTGDLRVCCHVCSPFFIPLVCGLCYKDQDYEFLFIFIYCHFLGLRNSAEEKALILLFLTALVPLQSPVAMKSCMKHACGCGPGGMGLLPSIRSFRKRDGREFS